MDEVNTKTKKFFGPELFLDWLFFHYVFFQIIGILRATAIYNTSYLANLSNVLLSLFGIILFMINLKRMKFKYSEIFLLLYPITNFIYGLFANGFNRNTLSHIFTSVFFAILLVYMRNINFDFKEKIEIKHANWMFWGLFTSIILYKIAPLVGVRVYSVGVISIYSLFPLIVYFQNRKKTKFLGVITLIILGGKRGVLLSGLLTFLFVGLGHRSIKKSTRIGIILSGFIFLMGIFYITSSPIRVSYLPGQLQPMLYRMMYTNPFSEYNLIQSDVRVLEVKGAMTPIIENPVGFLLGRGVGYSYEYFDAQGNFVENLHNTHFSPVSILSRYGIVYTLVLYCLILKIIYLNFIKMRRKKLSKENQVLLIYAIASFINSFTVFTIYIDYLFIISLALLDNDLTKKHNLNSSV